MQVKGRVSCLVKSIKAVILVPCFVIHENLTSPAAGEDGEGALAQA